MQTNIVIWAVVAAVDGFHVKEIPVENIGLNEIVALHPDRRSAEQGLRRLRVAMSLENCPSDLEAGDLNNSGDVLTMRGLAHPAAFHPY